MITDAQVHLWLKKPGDPSPTGSGTEQRPNGHGPEDMVAEMTAAGVDRVVIVPPGALSSNSEAQGFCDAYPGRFAVMGAFDPRAAGARQQLAGWMGQRHMLGVRVGFSTSEDGRRSFDDGSLDWFWNHAERLKIPIMALVGGMSARVYPLAQHHPGLPLIVDHMARPSRAAGIGSWADVDDLLRLGQLPNVHVKVSSAPNYSDEPCPYADIHPYLRRIYDAFGPRRMMWGTDLTRLRGTYRQCVLLFKEALPFLSAEDKSWILGRSVAETLNWPEA